MKQPVIFDGRNLFKPASVNALGIEYTASAGKAELAGKWPAGTQPLHVHSRLASNN